MLPGQRNKTSQLGLFEPEVGLVAFLAALARYLLSQSVLIFYYFRLLAHAASGGLAALKFYIVRRLIWGGGRLGRPVSHAGVLALSFAIFLVGGVFSGSGLVRGATIDPSATLGAGNQLVDVLSAETTIQTETPEDRPRDEVFIYEIQAGDTLGAIGEKFQISVETIRYANDLADADSLVPGQKLTILPVSGVRHEVKSGDTVETIADKYRVSPQTVVDFNYLNEPFALNIGDSLMVPDATVPQPTPAVPTTPTLTPPYAGSVTPGTGQFVWPTGERYITQYFSYYHPALDIAKYGAILAADGGTVVFAGWSPWGYGYLVEVDHGNGYKTGYAHLSRIDVSVGQTLGRGQVLGMMGATGRAYGVHLHFMVWENGRFINPLSVL